MEDCSLPSGGGWLTLRSELEAASCGGTQEGSSSRAMVVPG
eukprot:CAMPEP_0116852522 /NCGR_PEP_ID=MMETSP0418-20121206/17347_1 /TAXON_ID=1158023 /ORGANISM="Astrosyne radiata, Strain 13vi08-1A" /LENGTH=40 /DNA_ID= /DNA_START= /DNA_END= /DNA_ORIENTATION=